MPNVDINQLALVAVFAAVALLAGGIASLVLSRTDTGRRRLQQAIATTSTSQIPELLPLTSDGSLVGFWDDLARMLPRSKKTARPQTALASAISCVTMSFAWGNLPSN